MNETKKVKKKIHIIPLISLMFFGCIEEAPKYYTEENVTVAESVDVFCDQIDEADVQEIYDGGAVGSNGRFEAQLITDGGVTPRDRTIVGNAYYVLESLDVGGGEKLDKATPVGVIGVTLGAGNWSIRIQGERECEASFDFVIQPEKTLLKCILLECPDIEN